MRPIPNCRVGAALLDEQGRMHAGCNVENAAYPQACRTGALSALVLAGGRRLQAALVLGDSSPAAAFARPAAVAARSCASSAAGDDLPVWVADPGGCAPHWASCCRTASTRPPGKDGPSPGTGLATDRPRPARGWPNATDARQPTRPSRWARLGRGGRPGGGRRRRALCRPAGLPRLGVGGHAGVRAPAPGRPRGGMGWRAASTPTRPAKPTA